MWCRKYDPWLRAICVVVGPFIILYIHFLDHYILTKATHWGVIGMCCAELFGDMVLILVPSYCKWEYFRLLALSNMQMSKRWYQDPLLNMIPSLWPVQRNINPFLKHALFIAQLLCEYKKKLLLRWIHHLKNGFELTIYLILHIRISGIDPSSVIRINKQYSKVEMWCQSNAIRRLCFRKGCVINPENCHLIHFKHG